jgi:hypothetical protein
VKVQIVYLSPTDDIDSTRDMLGWVQAPRAVLVWPDRGEVLKRHFDLVMLKRFADQRQVALGLLTFNSEIRRSAKELGLPLFESLDDLPEARWLTYERSEPEIIDRWAHDRFTRPNDRQPTWAPQATTKMERLWIAVPVITIVLLVLFLPSANIVLSPPQVALEQVLNIRVDEIPGISEGIRLERGEARVSGQAEAPATGIVRTPLTPARGSVIFTNHSSEDVLIIAGTGLRTGEVNSIRFTTLEDAILTGGSSTNILIPVEAVSFGQVGNISANSVFSIDGALGLLVSASNPKPFRGGTDQVHTAVSASDYEDLVIEIQSQLLEDAQSEISANLDNSKLLVEGSIFFIESRETLSHQVNEITDRFLLTIELEAQAIILNRSDLEAILDLKLTTILAKGHELVPGSIKYRVETRPNDFGNLILDYQISSEAQSYLPINHEEVRNMVRGRTPEGALERLIAGAFAKMDPRIVHRPNWFPLMPLVSNRIEIDYEWAADG